MVKILHLSDIHMGSGFSHGRLNPATGINSRLEDFVKALSLCIDRAIAEPVDLVLFGGDAFPDATPPPYVQQAFASQFCRLAVANIPTILLVGNHDQHSQGNGGASLSIYETLAVPGFIVGDRITTHRIDTPNGSVQVITLPWLTNSALVTRPETNGLSLDAVNQLLLKKLEPILEGEIRKLDPTLPTVLLAHLMADRADFGAERFLAVGKGFAIPLATLSREAFDYVALGHVHRHQNLNPRNNPPIVYPGSIERVDFSEEKEEEGYILLDLEKNSVQWQFCPLPTRPFVTIALDLTQSSDPQGQIIAAIDQGAIAESVVRLRYQIRAEQLDLVNVSALNDALGAAHSFTIQPELISQLARPRLPELNTNQSLNPMDVLETYLYSRDDLKDIRDAMLDAAYQLLEILEHDELREAIAPRQ